MDRRFQAFRFNGFTVLTAALLFAVIALSPRPGTAQPGHHLAADQPASEQQSAIACEIESGSIASHNVMRRHPYLVADLFAEHRQRMGDH